MRHSPSCRKCNGAKTDEGVQAFAASGGVIPPPSRGGERPGDWPCPRCNDINYASRYSFPFQCLPPTACSYSHSLLLLCIIVPFVVNAIKHGRQWVLQPKAVRLAQPIKITIYSVKLIALCISLHYCCDQSLPHIYRRTASTYVATDDTCTILYY
jgi:hypothetical protein